QVMFAVLPEVIEQISAENLRALAVTTATRSAALPDVPALRESIPGFDASYWSGVAAPGNTPAEIVERLNTGINAALIDPKMKARLAELGGTAFGGSAVDFGTLVAEEVQKWAQVIKFAGVRVG